MQNENVSPHALTTAGKYSPASVSAATPLRPRNNQILSPASSNFTESCVSYSSLYQNHSPTSSPSIVASSDGAGDTVHRLRYDISILEYQQLYNRYTVCLSYLHDLVSEADDLRQENASLRLSNADLSNRIASVLSGDWIPSEFNRLSIGSTSTATDLRAASVPAAPRQLLAEFNRGERKNTERISVPKSISVRSKGYLDMIRSGREQIRQPALTTQKVYVPLQGVKMEEEAVELDVFNQGMFKTELCNKWAETGTCPYGENCQFAHGIKELRPVIRHPRYKTELCRMVLAGDICPYGHRCHFRHSLTEQERLMGAELPTL